MAVGNEPAQGGVNNYQSKAALKTKKVRTRNIDFSATDTGVAFYDADFDAYITGISILFSEDASATAVTLDVGISTDTNALVDAFSISQTATAGQAQAVTLTTALNETAGQAVGFYRVPAGTVLRYSYTGAANTAEGQLEVNYILIDAGI